MSVSACSLPYGIHILESIAACLTDGSYNRMVVLMQLAFNADQVFAALADATRRDVVLRALNGSEGVAELAGHYPMSFAAVQKHVAVLERAGLITKERTGRRKVVRTNTGNEYRHPVMLAKSIATLDLATGGRVEFGLGAGWKRSDYDESGMVYDPPGVRIDRMTELIASTEETIA